MDVTKPGRFPEFLKLTNSRFSPSFNNTITFLNQR